MKLFILISLLCTIPIIGMNPDVPEQTTTEFSEECLDKCGPGFAFGCILAGGLSGICIGIPVATAIGTTSPVTIPVLFTLMLGCGLAGSGYGSLLAITYCMKPGTPIRIIKQPSNTTQQPELNNIVIEN